MRVVMPKAFSVYSLNKKVSVTKRYNNHTLQTNHEEETHNNYSNKTPGRQFN